MRLNAKRVMAVGGASVDNDLCMPTAKEQDEAVGVTTIQILFIDAAINQVDSPQCENKLRLVRPALATAPQNVSSKGCNIHASRP